MTNRFLLLFGLMTVAGAVSAAPLVDGDAKAGQQKSAQCAACHGPKGNMVSAQFPKLAGQGSPYIYEQLMLFKSGKRNNAIMAGQVAGLKEKDMKNLAAYFGSQQTRPGAADESIAPAGATLYHGGQASKNIPACSGCHGPSGLGNEAAKFPRLSGQNPQYIVTQLTAYRDGKRSGYKNATIMNGVAQNLSDADIKALATYASGLAPATGNASSDAGALMQNVSDPAAAGGGGGQSKTGSDSGSAGAGDNAKSDSGEAGKPAAGGSADKAKADISSGKAQATGSGDNAGGDRAASGDAGQDSAQQAAGQKPATKQEPATRKDSKGSGSAAAASNGAGNGDAAIKKADQAEAAAQQETGSAAGTEPENNSDMNAADDSKIAGGQQ